MKSNRWYLGVVLLCLCVSPLFGQAINSSDLEKLSHRAKPDKPAPTEKRDDSFGNILLQAAGEMNAPTMSDWVAIAPVGEKFKVSMPGPARVGVVANMPADIPRLYAYGTLGRGAFFTVTSLPRYASGNGAPGVLNDQKLLDLQGSMVDLINQEAQKQAGTNGKLPAGTGAFYDGRMTQNGHTFHQYHFSLPEGKHYTRIYFQADRAYVVTGFGENETLVKRFVSSFRLGPVNRDAAKSNVQELLVPEITPKAN